MVGCAQSGGAGSHNGYSLILLLKGNGLFGGYLLLLGMIVDPVGHEALQSADGHGAVQLCTIAFIFARVITNTPDRCGEGVILFYHFQGFGIAPLADKGNISLGI